MKLIPTRSVPVALLLAAGQGRRFGGNKCLGLLPDGVPMVVHSASNVLAALGRLSCVIRAGDDALAQLLRSQPGVQVISTDQAEQGMSASLQAGVLAHSTAPGWLVALADMPLIQPATIAELVSVFMRENKVVVPCYRGQAGHPVIFPQRFRADLLALEGDRGAKPLLRAHAAECCYVEVDDAGILQDFDTVDALNRLILPYDRDVRQWRD